jgi:hypothetical protein
LKNGLLLATILVMVSVVGCAPVGKMPVEIEEAALMLEPGNDEALVYIVRPAWFGFAVKFKLWCDDEYLGATGGGRFIFTHQQPGSYVFISKAENTSELLLDLEGGHTYYLEQQVKLGGFKARANLVRLDAAEGREKLEKCSLSDDIVDVVPGSEEYMERIRRKKLEEEERSQKSQEF